MPFENSLSWDTSQVQSVTYLHNKGFVMPHASSERQSPSRVYLPEVHLLII